jgi:uncharacterized membrane-anchored protein
LAGEFVAACRAADRAQRGRALWAAGVTLLGTLATVWVAAGSLEDAVASLAGGRSLAILVIGSVVASLSFFLTRRARLS